MKTLLHLISWNIRRDRFVAAILVALPLASTAVPFLDLDEQLSEAIFVIFIMLYLGVAGFFTTRLVHTHAHLNENSFWLTRPFGQKTQLLSQYLTCILIIALPVFLSFAIQAIMMEGDWSPLFFTSVFLVGQMTAIFVAAIFTRNVFATTALLFVAVLVIVFSIETLERMQRGRLDLEPDSVMLAFPIAAAFVLGFAFLFRRYDARAKISYLAAALIVPAAALTTDFDLDDLSPNRSDDFAFSIRKSPTSSEHPISFIAFTQLTSLADDAYAIPIKADFQSGDNRYSIRYNEQWNRRADVPGPFIDRMLTTFPEETAFYSNSLISNYLLSHPLQGVTATKKNGHSAWPLKIEVGDELTGSLIHQIYQFHHLDLGILRPGAEAKKNGYSVKIHQYDPKDGQLRVRLNLKQFDNTIGIPKRPTYALVFYCPATGEALVSHINNRYLHTKGSLTTRVGRMEITMPAIETIASQGQKVECHFFISSKLGNSTNGELTVHPGVYDVELDKNWSKQNNLTLEDTKDEGFNKSFIATLDQIAPNSNQLHSARDQAVAKLNHEQLSSLVDALEVKSIPLSVLMDSFNRRLSAPIEDVIKLAKKEPLFFRAIIHYPEEEQKKSHALAAEFVKNSYQERGRLPSQVLVVAAKSNDPELAPAMLYHFPLMTDSHHKVHEYLLKFVSEEELEPAVVSLWKRAQASYVSTGSVSQVAIYYGSRSAFLTMVKHLESKDLFRRNESWALQHIKKHLDLTEEQASWPNDKLTLWISRNAKSFTYSETTKKWSAL